MMLAMAEWLGRSGRAGALMALALSWMMAAAMPMARAAAADDVPAQPASGLMQAPAAGQDEAARARQWEAELRQHEEQAQAELSAGGLAVTAKDFTQAEAHFRKSLELNPTPEAYFSLINLLGQVGGQGKEVERLWIAVITQFPGDRDVMAANAQRLYDAGHFHAALAELARGLHRHPGDPRMLCCQAACYEKLGDPGQAQRSYADALGAEYSADAVARLARVVAGASGYEEGEAIWRKYIELHPADAGLRYSHALSNQDSHPALARTELEQAVKLDPTSDVYFGALGEVCAQTADYSAAVQAYGQAIALQPLSGYYTGQAFAYYDLGRSEEALKCYQQALAMAPDDLFLINGYGLTLISAGQGAAGVKYLADAGERLKDSGLLSIAGKKAIEQHDAATAERVYGLLETGFPQVAACDAPYLAFQLARGKQAALVALLQSIKGKSFPNGECGGIGCYNSGITCVGDACRSADDAQLVFEPLIPSDPKNTIIYGVYASCLLRLKQADAALAVVRRGLNDAPNVEGLRLLEAQCVVQASGVDAALPLMKALINNSDANAATYGEVIDILPPQTEMPRIEALAAQGMKLFPENTVALMYYLARAYCQAEDYENVQRVMTDPGYRDPSLFDIEESTMLGHAYLHLGNYPKAIAYLKEPRGTAAAGALAYADLARAYYFLGEMNEARQALDKAQKLQPDLASAHVWLGFVQLGAGEVEAARQAFSALQSSLGASTEDLAWGALGRARVALLSGDKPAATMALSEAAAYGVKDGTLRAEIDATRKEVQQ